MNFLLRMTDPHLENFAGIAMPTSRRTIAKLGNLIILKHLPPS